MTVSTAPTPLSYAGTGAIVPCPITWKYNAKSHVVAALRSSSGAETVWALTTNYTLTDPGDTGTLTPIVAVAIGETLVITLEPPNTQSSDIPLGGDFPSTTVEDSLDLAAQRDAKVEALFLRAIRVPKTDTRTGSYLELPIDTDRASMFLAFDANGDPIVASGTSADLGPVSAFIDTLLDDTTAAAARTTLGAVGLTGNETVAGNKTLTGDNTHSGTTTLSGPTTLSGITTLSGTTTLSGKSLWMAEGANVASAADCNIWTTDGNTVHVTGNTQIDDWGTAPQAGAWKRVIIDGTPILGYNATTNDLPGDANITAAANDSFVVYARSTSSYQIFDYTKANGQAVVASTAAQGASLVLISSTTASASATIDFTSGLTSTYDAYEIHLVNVIPATDDVNLWMRTDADAGASFDAADYLYSGTGTSSAGTTLNYSPGAVQAQIVISSTAVGGSLDNNAGSGLCGVIKLFTPASTAVRKKFQWQVSYQNNEAGANHIANVSGSGAYTGTTALINAIRFLMSSGNIASGSFYLYGIKKA